MKISDYKGEAAFDLLDAIIEPVTVILADTEVRAMFQNSSILKIAKYCLKNHRQEVIEILAALEGESVEKYLEEFGVLTLPLKVVNVLSDKELLEVFRSAGAKKDEIVQSLLWLILSLMLLLDKYCGTQNHASRLTSEMKRIAFIYQRFFAPLPRTRQKWVEVQQSI